jgi:tetratricopeptide (TPR) repeat protein
MATAGPGNGEAIIGGKQTLLIDALFGEGLPTEAEWHLQQAGLHYRQDAVAEQHLRRARAIAPDHAAVLIGVYRYYFYKGRLVEALDIASICLAKAARDNDLVLDWRCVRRTDAAFSDFGAVLPRFYLFTLKAYAYLQMRLGDLEEGHDAVVKLLELDPSDKINAGVLLAVWQRIGQADDD